MMVYLCSPYTNKSRHIMDYREEQVSITAARLTHKLGVTFFLPITQSARMSSLMPGLFGHTFATWKDIDLDAIDHSDEVWVLKLPGWRESIGVTAEINHAKKKGKPVKYINHKTSKITKGEK